jgi:hypothetical protein
MEDIKNYIERERIARKKGEPEKEEDDSDY